MESTSNTPRNGELINDSKLCMTMTEQPPLRQLDLKVGSPASGDKISENDMEKEIMADVALSDNLNNDLSNKDVHSAQIDTNFLKTEDSFLRDDSSDNEATKPNRQEVISADSEDSALGSLPPEPAANEKEELQDQIDTIYSSDHNKKDPSNALQNELIDNQCDISVNTKITFSSRLKRKNENVAEGPDCKREKKSVKFANVTVYYFPRSQGFTCVPSQGGSSLGMEKDHVHVEQFTLHEHALEQRKYHKQILQQLKNERHNLDGVLSSSEDSDSEEEMSDISESELDLDSYYFLQPIPTRQRRALLRAAGVRKIEGFEKDECRDIRTSRELCGCACKVYCDPQQCSCSLAGIKCQVDRPNFPCGCTRDKCHNTSGRTEFNPLRVRSHYIHTLMKFQLEKKNEETMMQRNTLTNQYTENSKAGTTSITQMYTNVNQDILRDAHSKRIDENSFIRTSDFRGTQCLNRNSLNYTENISTTSSLNINTLQMNHTMNANMSNHYTPNVLQEKINYPNTTGFDNGVDRFYNINQPYPMQYSASHFEEFAQTSHMTMFNYGQLYMHDYMAKGNNYPINYQNAYHHTDEKNVVPEEVTEPQYTTLLSSTTNSEVNFETNLTDNWFNHELNQISTEPVQNTENTPGLASCENLLSQETSQDSPENFGELIKKTMVESVSV